MAEEDVIREIYFDEFLDRIGVMYSDITRIEIYSYSDEQAKIIDRIETKNLLSKFENIVTIVDTDLDENEEFRSRLKKVSVGDETDTDNKNIYKIKLYFSDDCKYVREISVTHQTGAYMIIRSNGGIYLLDPFTEQASDINAAAYIKNKNDLMIIFEEFYNKSEKYTDKRF